MPLSNRILEQLRSKNTLKNGKLKRIKRPDTWLYPHSANRQYTAALYEYTFFIRKTITEQLLPKIPSMLFSATMPYPDPIVTDGIIGNEIKTDDFIDFLNATMNYIKILLTPKEEQTIQKAKKFGIDIAIFNEKQYQKTIQSSLGIDVFLEEPWLKNQLELFANQNAQLINNLTDNELYRVSGIVQRGLQEGVTYDDIAKDIQQSFGITRRHAKLIARDQTTKLNGSLTKLRQQNLGVTQYRWMTAGDERVRKSHRVLDGKICRWDDSTVYLNEQNGKWEKRSKIGGTEVNPSQDVNCRCIPIAELGSLFDGN